MSSVDSDLLKMYLAGTVSFPPRNQGYGAVSVTTKGSKSKSVTLVKIEQGKTHESTIARTVFGSDVKAVFTPATDKTCELAEGTWYAGPRKVEDFIDKTLDSGKPVCAIVFVSEDAQSLLETKVGMTASECAEYYPPVAQKTTSGSHYKMGRTGCIVDPGSDYPPPVTPPGTGSPGGP